MVNAFIKPEFYSPDELADMDMYVALSLVSSSFHLVRPLTCLRFLLVDLSPEEIWRIDATNAAYYGFLDTTSTDANAPNKGHADALIELTAAGCEGLTAAWVENHWALILWKLASLVRSKPSLFGEEKFSWEEMIRQLKYRYVHVSHPPFFHVVHHGSLTSYGAILVGTSESTTSAIAQPCNGYRSKTRRHRCRRSWSCLRSRSNQLRRPTSARGTLLPRGRCLPASS